ncbi:hypothetical protein KY338_07175, partial [Candidatus Woesearchaeota archaeon]|nr:hypothetical protein [Candidatus Woesearchaeota archaeon]
MIRPRMSDEEKRKVLEELLKPVPFNPAGMRGCGDFNSLEWELQAQRQSGKTDKQLMYFDDSQKRLINAGYQ